MTMKENQIGISFDSISFGKETDALIFGRKDRYQLNDSRMDAKLTKLKAKDTGDRSNSKVIDDSSMDNEKGTKGSPKKAGQNGLSHPPSMDNENGTLGSRWKGGEDGLSHQLGIWDKDTDSSSSDSSDIEKEQRSQEHDSFDTVEEFADCHHNNSKDSGSMLFTDKNVLECDLPELEVCYKDIDCQILKDICIDEGRHQKDANVIQSSTNEKPGCLFPQPPNDTDHFEAEEDSSLDSVRSFTADQFGSKEENDGKTLVSQERLDTCLENSLEMDTIEHCEPENAAETGEAFVDTTGKAESDSSVQDSFVDRKLPIKDFGTPSSLGTDGGNRVMQVPDDQQFLYQEAVPESLASSAEAGGTGNDDEANCLLYNGKDENGSITFNFSSPEGGEVGNGKAENVDEQSADAGDVHKAENLLDAREENVLCTGNGVGDSQRQPLTSHKDVKEHFTNSAEEHKDVNYENLPDARDGKVQCTSNRVHDFDGQSLISNKGNSDGGSATSYHKCVTSEGSDSENALEGSPDHKQSNSDDIPTDNDPPSNKSGGPTNDAHTGEPVAPNHDGGGALDVPVVSHLQHDMGETSFSAASLIAYSGPIAFSGSLSHRSDGSATSGKSFAFPVLQSEWNSSPVRMAKADRRYFRKHKGWRSGLLCCRF